MSELVDYEDMCLECLGGLPNESNDPERVWNEEKKVCEPSNCESVIHNCSSIRTCYDNVRYLCEFCNDGYYLIQTEEQNEMYDDRCFPGAEILHCDECSPVEIGCHRCENGYYPSPTREQNTSCTTCQTITGCIECSTTEKRCTRCGDGMFPGKGGMCYSCESMHCNQHKCSSTDMLCEECEDGYYPNTNGLCFKQPPIPHCQQFSNTQRGCVECQTGYFIDGMECVEIHIEHCNQLSLNEMKCIECEVGHFVEEGECVDCRMIHCKPDRCSTTNKTCDECEEGFTFNQSSMCHPQQDEINECQTYGITSNGKYYCVMCSDGLVFDEEGRCVEFDINCEKCSHNHNKCVQCDDGFTQIMGKCVILLLNIVRYVHQHKIYEMNVLMDIS